MSTISSECLYGMEQDGDPIPQPSDPAGLTVGRSEAIVLVEVFMPLVRDIVEERAIKKALTTPKWLNDLAGSEEPIPPRSCRACDRIIRRFKPSGRLMRSLHRSA
jgi:hypothetical protein